MGGVQWRPEPVTASGPFSAAHISSYDENDWDLNLSLQAGWRLGGGPGGATMDLAAEYYVGRPKQGEFAFDDREQYIGAALTIDIF